MSTPIKIYICRCGPRSGNFGDELSLPLIAAITRRQVEYVPKINEADIVSCGSIAQELTPDFKGFVWGTGGLYEHVYVNAPQAKICALRGHLIRSRFTRTTISLPLGDPALVFPQVCLPGLRLDPQIPLGIVPHYVDFDNELVAQFIRNNPQAVIIDPCAPVADVFRCIAKCRVIISSSLHGLIAADAIGIPNHWIRPSEKLAGGYFKFRDYYSLFGIEDPLPLANFEKLLLSSIIEICEMTSDHLKMLPGIKQRLMESFPKELMPQ